MYKTQSINQMKVFDGTKYKTVSYAYDSGIVTFTTSCKSNKYNEFKATGKIKVKNNTSFDDYKVSILEDSDVVDDIFFKLKRSKVIPFFIPRKNKIIVQYPLNI